MSSFAPTPDAAPPLVGEARLSAPGKETCYGNGSIVITSYSIHYTKLYENRRFAARGGKKYLYSLFAGGPVTQGSRLANLRTPANATDVSFGTSY